MHEFSLTSERRTQLIDITERVREAIGGSAGSAVLVYVPHTTAAITINEKIDPVLVEDLERGFERLVGEDWGWRHDDIDGPERALARPCLGRRRPGADPAARRGTGARPLPGDLPLRVRRAEGALGLRHRPPVAIEPPRGRTAAVPTSRDTGAPRRRSLGTPRSTGRALAERVGGPGPKPFA